MLVAESRFLFFNTTVSWWPKSSEKAARLLDEKPVVTIMQCEDDVAAPLLPYAFRQKPFHTLLCDLTQSEEALWQQMKKSCRREIRKADELGFRLTRNEDYDEALALIRSLIDRTKYRSPLKDAEWQRIITYCDVFVMWHGDRAIAADVIAVDEPRRARALMGATADRNDLALKSLIGPFNRAMIWEEMKYYKAQGTPCYDFGGVDLDPDSPCYTITRFKQSFGGEVVKENILYLTSNPVLRRILAASLNLRRTFRPVTFLS